MEKNTIEKSKSHEVARPLKVLVPLIKHDLEEAKRAGMPYFIKAGSHLLEAKSQLDAMSWGEWLDKNFHMSRATADAWMRAAVAAGNGDTKFKTLNEVRGDKRRFGHAPDWTEDVKESVRGHEFDTERKNLRQHDLSIEKEEKLEHALAIRLIDIGYKVLSVELHPDKKGGSTEAMRRLNKVRALLKEAV